jgi:hypothetical protein
MRRHGEVLAGGGLEGGDVQVGQQVGVNVDTFVGDLKAVGMRGGNHAEEGGDLLNGCHRRLSLR